MLSLFQGKKITDKINLADKPIGSVNNNFYLLLLMLLNFFKYVHCGLSAIINWVKSSLAEEYNYGSYFLWYPVFLGVGICIYFALSFEPSFITLLSLNLLFLFLIYLFNKSSSNYYILLFTYCFFITLGMSASKFEADRLSTRMLYQPVITNLTGVIESIDKRDNGRYRATLRVDNTDKPKLFSPPQKVQINLPELPSDVTIGSILQGRVRLAPFFGSIISNSFNFNFQQYFNGIGARGTFIGEPTVNKNTHNLSLLGTIGQLVELGRLKLTERIYSILPGDTGAISAALITGKRGNISSETNYNLRIAGLAHILAISGLHMSLTVGFVLLLFRYLFSLFPVFSSRYQVQKIAAFIALIVAAIYLLLSGMAVAALRSFIMVAVILVAVIMGKTALTLRNLAISALIILLIFPHQLLTAGFQLSFGATLILLASGEWLQKITNVKQSNLISGKKSKIRNVISKFILTPILVTAFSSFIVGIGSGIFALYHFDNIASLGVVSNILVFPVVSILIMPAALIGSLLAPFHADYYFFILMGAGIDYVKYIASLVASISYQGKSGFMPISSLIFFALGLLWLCCFRSKILLAFILFFVIGSLLFFNKKVPDILVSQKFIVASVNKDTDILYPQKSNVTRSFELKNWQNFYQKHKVITPLEKNYLAKDEQFMCNGHLCMSVLKNGDILAVANNKEVAQQACKIGDVVILAYPDYHARCDIKNELNKPAVVINSQDLGLWGNVAIYISGHQYKLIHTEGSLSRPWNKHKRMATFD